MDVLAACPLGQVPQSPESLKKATFGEAGDGIAGDDEVVEHADGHPGEGVLHAGRDEVVSDAAARGSGLPPGSRRSWW